VERTTRYTILVPLKVKDAESVRKAYAKELGGLPAEIAKTLTYDHGKEMSGHQRKYERYQRGSISPKAPAFPLSWFANSNVFNANYTSVPALCLTTRNQMKSSTNLLH